MINLKYSLTIEATEDPTFFSFYSTELEGFSSVGHSVEDCLYQARWGMEEYLELLRREGFPILDPPNEPTVLIRNERARACGRWRSAGDHGFRPRPGLLLVRRPSVVSTNPVQALFLTSGLRLRGHREILPAASPVCKRFQFRWTPAPSDPDTKQAPRHRPAGRGVTRTESQVTSEHSLTFSTDRNCPAHRRRSRRVFGLFLRPINDSQTSYPFKVPGIVRHEDQTVTPGVARDMEIIDSDCRPHAFQIRRISP